jgi:ATP-binding cassette subfamily F protein uup
VAAGSGPGRAAAERAARKELQRLERQIERLTGREAKLHEELAASASDYVRLTELDKQLREVQAEKAELEDRWLTVAADLPT